MGVSLNWQPVIGGLLLIAGAVFAGVQWWRSRPAVQQVAQTSKPEKPGRSADAPAPAGAVEYIKDIEGALLGAPADMILECVRSGLSRDAARSVRIQGLLKSTEEPKA